MESQFPKPTLYGDIKSYWRRRRYRRLHGGATTGRRKMMVVRLKSSPRKNWKIRALPRLRWVIRSPLKMLRKLKNAYMNFMLRVAGKVGAMNGDNIFGEKRIPKAPLSKGYSGAEFEARLIYEISKTLVASYELHPI